MCVCSIPHREGYGLERVHEETKNSCFHNLPSLYPSSFCSVYLFYSVFGRGKPRDKQRTSSSTNVHAECRGFESHSRKLNFSKKKWALLSAVELFALHLRCCSSMIHAHDGVASKYNGVIQCGGMQKLVLWGQTFWGEERLVTIASIP